MNIFNRVTLKSLKENKTRTIVTIIGIILSAAMICAVTTFVSSIYNYVLEICIYDDGDWHGSALEADRATLEMLLGSDQLETVVYAQRLGYAYARGCLNEHKPYLFVLGAAEGFEKTMPIHITAGRYPRTAGEILLPDHLAENGGVYHAAGDVLTLELGERTHDGYTLGQNNPFIEAEPPGQPEAEALAPRETRTYTVVGFYQRPSFENFSSPGYTAITVADADPPGDARWDVYYKMNDAREVYSFMSDNQLSGTRNTSVLTYSGVSRYSSLDTMLTGLASIVIGLIIFGSVSLIYNAFSISVSERTRQFGLLSSVGATKKQLGRMVFFEALAVSAVGIPLGILAGIGGIGTTLLIIGERFQDILVTPIPLRVSVSGLSIVLAAAIALVTVLISAWIPSRRATRVSAVEAIRQNRDVRAKGKPVKTSRLTYRLFGLPGVLAQKHYRRSRKKYRTTVVSLFMSIVLFVSASAFTEYLMESVGGSLDAVRYDLQYYCNSEDLRGFTKDSLLELLAAGDGVTGAAYVQRTVREIFADGRLLTNEALDAPQASGAGGTGTGEKKILIMEICFVSDGAFRAALAENGLDEAEYMNPDAPLALIHDKVVSFSQEEQRYVSMSYFSSAGGEVTLRLEKDVPGYVYDSRREIAEGQWVLRYVSEKDPERVMEIPEEEGRIDVPLKYGKILDEAPFFKSDNNIMTLFYPDSAKRSVIPGFDETQYTFQYLLTSDDPGASWQDLSETLRENGLAVSNYFVNIAEIYERDRSMVVIIRVFSYGFIVLISLIAAANVFNTISTNIGLRRREFAMLRSAGMSARGFSRMMNYECLLYGSRALLYGLPASAGVTWLIYRAVSAGYSTGFRLPWAAVGVAVLSVFAVVFATMVYSMRKVKKENPIDALRSENL